ncbi:MAG: sialidase family protein [Candidatus Nitrosocaldus sp.]
MIRLRDRGLVAVLIASLLVYAIMQYMGIGIIPLRSIITGDGSISIANSGILRADVVMAVEGSDVYIAWHDPVNDAIMLRASNDGGATFRDPILVYNTEGVDGVRLRGIIAKGSYVNILWSGESNGQYDIFLSNSSSSDGYALVFSTINLSNNEGDSEYPVIDASGPTVYVAWVDLTYGSSEILLRISNDGGSTFSNTLNISDSSGESEAPTLVADGSNVYIAWHDNSQGSFAVTFRASHDNGNTFSDPVILSSMDATTAADSGFVSMDADGSSVYMVWMSSDSANNNNGDDFGIYMGYSDDGGRSFSDVVKIGEGRSPIVKADGSLVCIAWIANDGLRFTSMYGKSIRDTIAVATDDYDVIRSIILDVEGRDVGILLLLERDKDESSIMYINSKDSGLTISSPIVVKDGVIIDDVSMLSKGRGVYIAWSEKICTDPNCSHVRFGYHFGKSSDGGHKFTKKGI